MKCAHTHSQTFTYLFRYRHIFAHMHSYTHPFTQKTSMYTSMYRHPLSPWMYNQISVTSVDYMTLFQSEQLQPCQLSRTRTICCSLTCHLSVIHKKLDVVCFLGLSIQNFLFLSLYLFIIYLYAFESGLKKNNSYSNFFFLFVLLEVSALPSQLSIPFTVRIVFLHSGFF